MGATKVLLFSDFQKKSSVAINGKDVKSGKSCIVNFENSFGELGGVLVSIKRNNWELPVEFNLSKSSEVITGFYRGDIAFETKIKKSQTGNTQSLILVFTALAPNQLGVVVTDGGASAGCTGDFVPQWR